MATPRLSVIIPNFNHGKYLPRSVGAVLRQSVQPLEILVVDDASTDDSVAVVESIAREQPIVRLHRNERNLGVIANMNRSLDLARGDYLLLAAADDEIAPGFLEKSLGLLERHPVAAFSCTIGDYREAATGLRWLWGVGMSDTPTYLSPERMVSLERQGRFYIPPNSVIYRKSALAEVGRFRPELKYVCDWYATFVAGFRHGICFVPEPLAVFHVQPNSYYHRSRRDKAVHQQVMRDLLDALLGAPQQDAIERIRRSGALFLFGWPMLKTILGRREYRRFLTGTFLRKDLWHCIKLGGKRVLPRFAAEWYLRLAGYRAADPGG